MNRLVRGIRITGSQAGFTLAELLAAVFVISLGLVAVGAGFATAIQGVETSRQQTTATFLAEQRLEQVHATALGNSLVACMGFANITAACFPAQAYSSITNAPGYRSTVTITDYIVNGNIARKRVDVEVFYRPIVAWGVLTAERSVRLSTLIANHT
ncbi:MAG: prepilin-type N-terminal cleavage/methylation domain-containing protein [Candidatus Rokubacteria bacterium]|nr:prepilin-type N-terminal cleavage/methylation domain-containing protein [Candidatus Rokubacteria bacterium]